jgi:hypothetical protein
MKDWRFNLARKHFFLPNVPLAFVPFVLTMWVGTSIAQGQASAAGKDTNRPNILSIYTDDQSHRTVSSYPEAYSWAETPNIDHLAQQGVRFASAYIRIGQIRRIVRISCISEVRCY